VGPETLTETLGDTVALMSTNPRTAAPQCVHTRGALSSGWHRQRRSARIIAVRVSVGDFLFVCLVKVRDSEMISIKWKSNDLVFGQVKTIVAHHPIKVDLRDGISRTLYEKKLLPHGRQRTRQMIRALIISSTPTDLRVTWSIDIRVLTNPTDEGSSPSTRR
jgi:hypothetical protein